MYLIYDGMVVYMVDKNVDELDLEEVVKKYVFLNIKQYGKSNPKAIVGKVLAQNPEFKSDVANVMSVIDKYCQMVSLMDVSSIDKVIADNNYMMAEKPKKRVGLKPLNGVSKSGVVMRFEPSPSGPLHIGHAFPLTLNMEYVRMYGGKLIIRISDTNPDNIYVPAYDMIVDDVLWLIGNDLDKEQIEVVVQSDRLELYYDLARKVINKGGAYVCTCNSEIFRELLLDKKACPCRSLSVSENMNRFKMMFKFDGSGYKQGEAVLRIKTDIKHKNPSIRDWPAMRINETCHPRQGNKYRVWPLMNFSVAVDDLLLSMTHVLNGKDQMANSEKQKYLHKHLGVDSPSYIQVGKIQFDNAPPVSCSKCRVLIDDGTYSGWDDPRILFLISFKKRGYVPECFKKFYIDMGVSNVDKRVDYKEFMKTIDFYNKQFSKK
jgi:glutamyl-tRNA synthetase